MIRQHLSTDRAGFSLVEVVVAVVILAVVFTGLVPVLLRGADQQRRAQADAVRQAGLLTEASRFQALPFDSLGNYASASPWCQEVPGMRQNQQVCVTVVPVSTKEMRVEVVITPAEEDVALGLRADTLEFWRTRPGAPNPF